MSKGERVNVRREGVRKRERGRKEGVGEEGCKGRKGYT